MKIIGNIRLVLCGVLNKQKHHSTFVVFLMIHGISTVVLTQSFKHSLFNNHSSLGNHVLLVRNLFQSNNSDKYNHLYNTLMNSKTTTYMNDSCHM